MTIENTYNSCTIEFFRMNNHLKSCTEALDFKPSFQFIHSFIQFFVVFISFKTENLKRFLFIHSFIYTYLFSASLFFGIFIVLSMPVNVCLLYRFTTFSCSFATHNLNNTSTNAKYHHPYACFDTAMITSSIDCFDSVKYKKKMNKI